MYKYSLFIILSITLAVHLLFLNQIPWGITNDELHFVLNAKSVFLKFTNLSANWNPFSLSVIPDETSSELPFLLFSPIIGPMPLNLFTARLPLALLSVIFVLLIYLISRQFFNHNIALIISLMASLNPWLIYTYRSSFDAPLAIIFFLLAFYFLIRLPQSRSLYSIIPIFFAFYTYIATKSLLFPFVFIITSYVCFFLKQIKLNHFLIINAFALLLSLNFIFNLSRQNLAARNSELILPFDQSQIETIRFQRSQTLTSPLSSIYINKGTLVARQIITKWLNSFSPNLLFLKGDDTFIGSLWIHGYFYSFEIFTLLLGLAFIFYRYRRVFYLLLILLIISPVPEIIRRDIVPAYVFHAALEFPLLIIISGAGLYYLLTIIKKIFFFVPLLALYLIFFSNFLFIYFFRYPYFASESFALSNRVMSNYLISESSAHPNRLVIIVNEPDTLFKNYIFYSDMLNRRTFNDISSAYRQRPSGRIVYKNLVFTADTNNLNLSENDIVIVQTGINPPPGIDTSRQSSILHLNDHLPAYTIYNGNLCHSFSYNPNTTFSSLNITSDPSTFCSNFIVDTF